MTEPYFRVQPGRVRTAHLIALVILQRVRLFFYDAGLPKINML
jgi:hypothetical protein